jgi:hypothetical protein
MANIKLQKLNTGRAAFTLIETILYLAIAVTMMLAIFAFLTFILQARLRYVAISEVEQQGSFAMSVMAQNLRYGLNGPAVFAVNNGVLTEIIGGSQEFDLTSPQVQASNFQLTNLTPPGSPAVTRVRFTLSSGNYSANFYDSFSLRQ